MRISEIIPEAALRRSNYWFDPGFDPAIKNFIETHAFKHPSLVCQIESLRWANRLMDHGITDVKIANGRYDDGRVSIGHHWVLVQGHIFDPTLEQIRRQSKVPRSADHYEVDRVYEVHPNWRHFDG